MTHVRLTRMTGNVAALLSLSAFGLSLCPAQTVEKVSPESPFAPAIEGQKRALAEIASILEQEKVMLSEGAVQLELERLLSDEQKQGERVGALLSRTAGRNAAELTGQDRSDRDQLADNQEVCADHYRRLEKGIEANAAARPDSVYARLLSLAVEGQLAQTLGEAAKQIRGNQLGNASRSTKKAVDLLREMLALLTQKAAAPTEPREQAPRVSVTLPSLLQKAAGEKLAQFDWLGTQADPLGVILAALQKLKELAEQQRAVADLAKSQAADKEKAPDLARQETDIRRQSLEIGGKLAPLDPRIDQLIRMATASIEEAMPGMEKGPLAKAVEPAARAAEQLQAAADYLDKLWKNILALLKKYTQEAQQPSGRGAGGAVPHGMSQEVMERLQKVIMVMLKATGALTRAIETQSSLIDRAKTVGHAQLPTLKPEEEGVAQLVAQEVIPFHDSLRELPRNMAAIADLEGGDSAVEFLRDAVARAVMAAAALGKPDRTDALNKQKESLAAMTHSLDLMVKVLQRLLGQLAPSAVTPGGRGAAGVPMDPTGSARRATGWLFGLPSQKQESVRQAFLESFPRRYSQAIRDYYQVIAREKESGTGAGAN
jgi:hypothetical protein